MERVTVRIMPFASLNHVCKNKISKPQQHILKKREEEMSENIGPNTKEKNRKMDDREAKRRIGLEHYSSLKRIGVIKDLFEFEYLYVPILHYLLLLRQVADYLSKIRSMK